MPNAPDKIIINNKRARGTDALVKQELAVSEHLAVEILERGWEKETNVFRDEMNKACAEHHAAEMKYHAFLRDYNDRLAAFVDNHP